MIQRIQTVYLLLAVVAVVIALTGEVGHFHREGIEIAGFNNFFLALSDGVKSWSPWALSVLLILPAVLSSLAIFLFKRRMVQVRLTVASALLLVGYYIVFAVFVYIYKGQYDADFTLHWTTGLPAVALILEYLAFRGIMKDELIVRSLDRLR